MMQSDILVLQASWDELAIKYAYLVKPPVSSSNTLIVSIVTYQIEVTAAIPTGGFVNAEEIESDWLNDVQKKTLLDYLQITLSLLRFEEIVDQKMLCADRQPILKRQITNPSILHLAHLLRAEMEAPKFFSQQFVSSIIKALIIHCWYQL
ncbi:MULTISPECIES: hypothetical protein [Nostocales]|uniref:Uncharacterized protein n=4 Tax=Nostocales TaxID=1161 RepID=A0A8S9T350_9CYAN|nr:hypothetical protein [Tolypothrix bouteillei]KAF3885969.1 hypothetical protein DA73_0400011175 [Tolypothrix bouteillei VB521301]